MNGCALIRLLDPGVATTSANQTPSEVFVCVLYIFKWGQFNAWNTRKITLIIYMFNILCDSRNYIKCTSFHWYKTNISLNPVSYTNTEGLLGDQPTENESNHVEMK